MRTEVADIFTEKREVILSRWETLVRSELSAAKEANSLALRDHLPSMLEDIGDALAMVAETGDCKAAGIHSLTDQHGEKHGRQRATIEGYSVGQIYQEYILLRHVIVGVLREEGMDDWQAYEAVTRVLETGAMQAVAEFAKSLEELQQTLMGTLAHDIRTPLSVARTALSFLDSEGCDAQSAREVRHMAETGIDRGLDMLSGLLDTIVAEAGDGIVLEFEEADFASALRGWCREADLTYCNRIVSTCPESPVPGVFDQIAIRRIFDNLVSNAIRYGATNSPVTVGLEEQDAQVVLSVRNLGKPIRESRRQEIFEFLSPEYRSPKDGARRWGVGLAFVKLAAEGHQGSVRVESGRGDGTTFFVTLPRFDCQPGKARARMS